MNKDSTADPWETGTDELEHSALDECVRRQRLDHHVSVMVMPANHCALAIQFADRGARVLVADHADRQHDVEGRILAAGLGDSIAFTPCEMPRPPANTTGAPFDIIFLRRSLCAVPYEEARDIVRKLLRQMRIGGKLYLSVLGLHSELAEGYPGKEQPVGERYAGLAPAIARKYAIPAPVCLYSERDVFMLLLESGASVLRTLTTTYGNVKAVAVRM